MKPTFHSLPVLFTALVAACALAAACGSDTGDTKAPPGTTTIGTGNGGGVAGGTGGTDSTSGGAGGSGGSVSLTRATIVGDATWTVTFDATAQAAGKTNCSYTRHYQGSEDESAPWLCPTCEIAFHTTVQMTNADCYQLVSGGADPQTEEWVGYVGTDWWRGRGPTSQQGTAAFNGDSVTWTNHVADQAIDPADPAQGMASFDVAGQFTIGQESGDPMNGYAAAGSYQCGWPKANPAPYAGDYLLVKDAVLPDGTFKDSCDDAVRLHDFAGQYLVVDMSARDCPACQAMAQSEEQFVSSMAGQGIPVTVITLLATSLDNPWGAPSKAQLTTWISNYSLTSPVLADRIWGISMFVPTLGPTDSLSYPSWIIVRPDLTVLDWGSGFNDFSAIQAAIVTDHG
jgi:hypothetical protein